MSVEYIKSNCLSPLIIASGSVIFYGETGQLRLQLNEIFGRSHYSQRRDETNILSRGSRVIVRRIDFFCTVSQESYVISSWKSRFDCVLQAFFCSMYVLKDDFSGFEIM